MTDFYFCSFSNYWLQANFSMHSVVIATINSTKELLNQCAKLKFDTGRLLSRLVLKWGKLRKNNFRKLFNKDIFSIHLHSLAFCLMSQRSSCLIQVLQPCVWFYSVWFWGVKQIIMMCSNLFFYFFSLKSKLSWLFLQ